MKPIVLLNATHLRPSEAWLASSLMFADRVSTLTVPGKGCPFPELEELDMWKPANLGDLSLDEADELVKDIEALSEQDQFVKTTNTTPPMRLRNNFIYQEKFPTRLQDSLINSEHLVSQVDDDGRSRLVGNQDFIDAVLNLAGGSLAKVKEEEGWTLAVRNKTEVVINLAPMPVGRVVSINDNRDTQDSEDHSTIGQSLEVPFPILASGVTLKQVLEFRESHKDQFLRFRESLTEITCDPLVESTANARTNEYFAALEHLVAVAARSGLGLRVETRNFIRKLKLTDTWAGKNVSATRRAALLLTNVLAVYAGVNLVGDLANLEVAAALPTSLTLSLHLVQLRRTAPSAYMKKAHAKGLIAY